MSKRLEGASADSSFTSEPSPQGQEELETEDSLKASEMEENEEKDTSAEVVKKPSSITEVEWNSLSEEAKRIVARREKEREAYFTRQSQQIKKLQEELLGAVNQLKESAKTSTPESSEEESEVSLSEIDISNPKEVEKWISSKVDRVVKKALGEAEQNVYGKLQEVERKQVAQKSQEIWEDFVSENPDAADLEKDMLPFFLASSEPNVRKRLLHAYKEAKNYREFRSHQKRGPQTEKPKSVSPSGKTSVSERPKTKSLREAYDRALAILEETGVDVSEFKK